MSNKTGILEAIDKTPNGKKSMLFIAVAILLVIGAVFGALLLG